LTYARERIVRERIVRERIVRERIVLERIVRERIVRERIVRERIIRERIVRERIVRERIVRERIVRERIVRERIVLQNPSTSNYLTELPHGTIQGLPSARFGPQRDRAVSRLDKGRSLIRSAMRQWGSSWLTQDACHPSGTTSWK